MRMVTCALYHHIGKETAFEHGLNITTSPAAFAAQIDWMADRYSFITLDQLMTSDLPRRPMLLTFDDAFLSVVEAARTVLAPRGIPAVYFVNPGMLAQQAISLDSALAWAANTFGLERLCMEIDVPVQGNLGALVVGEMSKYSAERRDEIKQCVLATFGPIDLSGRAPLMSTQDLRAMPGLGVEIGNHTSSHVHCRSLTESEISIEIGAAKAELERLSDSEVRSFSIPYGHEDDLTPPVHEAIRASGHKATFLVHARANIHRPAPDVWYRTSLHNEPPNGMAKHLRYLPLLRSAKKALLG